MHRVTEKQLILSARYGSTVAMNISVKEYTCMSGFHLCKLPSRGRSTSKVIFVGGGAYV